MRRDGDAARDRSQVVGGDHEAVHGSVCRSIQSDICVLSEGADVRDGGYCRVRHQTGRDNAVCYVHIGIDARRRGIDGKWSRSIGSVFVVQLKIIASFRSFDRRHVLK